MEHAACLACPHVIADERPVRVLIHHHDGTWQAVCGETDHDMDIAATGFAIVGVNHLFARQPDLTSLQNLKREQIAEWSVEGWIVSAFDENA
jgi:hypothetical protein